MYPGADNDKNFFLRCGRRSTFCCARPPTKRSKPTTSNRRQSADIYTILAIHHTFEPPRIAHRSWDPVCDPCNPCDPLPPSMASQSSPSLAQAADTTQQKRIHSLIVDTGPLIKNEPALSTLIAQAEQIYTIPSVITEIKDEATRSRVQTTLIPFLKLRSPRPESIKFITDFARRTGDLEVLSKPDIHLLALSYELEIERNHGDWRIKKTPGQKHLNGKPPGAEKDKNEAENDTKKSALDEQAQAAENVADPSSDGAPQEESTADPTSQETSSEPAPVADVPEDPVETKLGELSLEQAPAQSSAATVHPAEAVEQAQEVETIEAEDDEDDEDGWITPSNLKKHQAKDSAAAAAPSEAIQGTLQAALLTSDFAMQNVALRMNLNLVSPSNMSRIKQLKTWVLRCYGCFHWTRQMDRQFCPKCGQATLTRTSCSTDSSGNMRLHLKKNFQYNKRGNVYSIPKPVHGTANGRQANVQGGGKNNWGTGLILTEDQKEYTRKAEEDRRARQRDLMDEDYLPNIVSGERTGGHGRIRVGAGRNVNAKKRR
ncbi:Nin one binding Zn-ribbon like-domain-containing protein [Coniella lustricola]|uniref:20S-pre-rRNA D-site endonuclease NOB1 n=1 Tax=Coniella lustricola TaxID=2025994 RepID=A0A2T3A2L3_9PEZI|nr:Nin one binding Zn-ribbon like-domain-containing protein [Coniella lustricola]